MYGKYKRLKSKVNYFQNHLFPKPRLLPKLVNMSDQIIFQRKPRLILNRSCLHHSSLFAHPSLNLRIFPHSECLLPHLVSCVGHRD